MAGTGLTFEFRNAREYEAVLDRLDAIIRRLNRHANEAADAFNIFEKSFEFRSRQSITRTVDEIEKLDRALRSLNGAAGNNRFADSLRLSLANAFRDVSREFERVDFAGVLEDEGVEAGRRFARGFRTTAGADEFDDEGERAGRGFLSGLTGIFRRGNPGEGLGRAIADDVEQGLRRGVGDARTIGSLAGDSFTQGFRGELSGLGRFLQSERLQDFDQFISQPIRDALNFSTQAAIDFESAIAGIAKTIDFDESFSLETLVEGIEALATGDNPLAGLENAQLVISQIAESAGQLGVAREDILAFTEVAGQLLLSTDLTLEGGITALAQFTNITGTAVSEFDNLGAAIVALGNDGASTESQIIEFAQRIAGAGIQAGLTEQNVLGLSGALASLGLNPEAAGTAITQFLNATTTAVADGGAQLQAFARLAGVTAEEFAETFQNEPIEAIALFAEGLSGLENTESVRVLESLGLDGVRLSDTLRRLASNTGLLRDQIDLANGAWDENTALVNEANRRYETTQAQLNRLQNNVRAVAGAIGGTLLEGINSKVEFIVPLLQSLADANPGLLRLIAILGSVVAAAGPILIFFAQLSNAVATLGLSSAGIGGLVAAIAPLAAAVAALVGGFILLRSAIPDEQFARLTEAVGGTLSAITELVGAGINLVTSFISRVVSVAAELLGIESSIQSATSGIQAFVEGIIAGLDNATQRIREVIDLFDLVAVLLGGAPSQALELGTDPAALQQQNQLLQRQRDLQNQIFRAREAGARGLNRITIEAGQTLSQIAAQYGVSVEELARLNNIENPSLIFAGQALTVPIEPEVDTSALEEDLRQTTLEIFRAQEAAATNGERQLGALETLFNRVRETDIFKSIFGDADLAEVQARIADLDAVIAGVRDKLSEAAGKAQDFVASFALPDGTFTLTSITDRLKELASQIDVQAITSAIRDRLSQINIGEIVAGIFGGGASLAESTGIGSLAEDATSLLPALDFSGIVTSISQSIQGIDLTSLQTPFEAKLSDLLGVLGVSVGIVFPPVGGILGIGSAITRAIENDFLGIGTLLNETGINTSITDAFNGLKDTVQGILDTVFGQTDSDAQAAAPQQNAFFDFINSLITGLPDLAAAVTPEIQETIENIRNGITGFIDAIAGADTSGLDEVAVFLAKLAGGIGLIVGVGLDILSDLFENIFPNIGEAIAGIISAVSALGEGNAQGFLDALLGSISAIGAIPAEVIGTVIDGIVEALNDLLGLDIPSLEEIGNGIRDFAATISLNLLRNIADFSGGISDFIDEVEEEAKRANASLLQTRLDFENGLDQFGIGALSEEQEFEIEGLIGNFNASESAERLRNDLIKALQDAGAQGINPAEFFFTGAESGTSGTIAELFGPLINDPFVVEQLGYSGRVVIEQALQTAIETADVGTVEVLKPALINGIIDPARARQIVTEEITQAIQSGDQEAFELAISLAPGLIPQSEIDAFRTQFQDQIQSALRFEPGTGPLVSLTGDTDITPVADASARQIGRSFADGVTAGLRLGRPALQGEVDEIVEEDLQEGLTVPLESRSPSRWAQRAGKDFVDGLVGGLTDNRSLIQNILALFIEDFQVFADEIQKVIIRIANIFSTLPAKVAPGLSAISSQLTSLGNQFNLLALRAAAAEAAIRRALAVGDVPNAPGGNGQDIGLNPGGGGRRYGGPVFAGELYEVAEDGLSELLRFNNGRTFLIPGQDGVVIPPAPAPVAGLPFAQAPSPLAGIGDTIINAAPVQNVTLEIVAAPGQSAREIAEIAVTLIEQRNRDNNARIRLINMGRT
jgi:TP901 family phage tail tape measure protein